MIESSGVLEDGVRDRTLTHLLAMLDEADRLSAQAPRVVPRRPVSGARLSARGWVAAAAAAVLAFAFIPRELKPGDLRRASAPWARAAVGHVDLTATASRDDGVMQFRPVSSDPMTAMVLARGWNWDCHCMAWSLLPWENGSIVTELSPEQRPELAFDAGDLPPYDHFVILAAAPSRAALPIGPDEEGDLLACLNEQPAFDAGLTEPGEVSAYVQRCLPGGVTVVSRSFCPGE